MGINEDEGNWQAKAAIFRWKLQQEELKTLALTGVLNQIIRLYKDGLLELPGHVLSALIEVRDFVPTLSVPLKTGSVEGIEHGALEGL